MRLSRRDALAVLAAAGAGGVLAGTRPDDGHDGSFTEREVETLTALAEVLYPTAATGVAAFVETYVVGRTGDRPAYRSAMVDATAVLDSSASDRFGARFAELPRDDREGLLREEGVDAATPDPEGSDVQRVRYYLVNELLFAFYASPVGGRLVGIENPPGHPGGIESYRRGSAGSRSDRREAGDG